MGDDKENDIKEIKIEYDTGVDSYTYSPPNENGTFTVTLDSLDDTSAPFSSYTVDGITPSWATAGSQGSYVDEELVETNPTCKALWEQFQYVYNMVKADKENSEENDDLPF